MELDRNSSPQPRETSRNSLMNKVSASLNDLRVSVTESIREDLDADSNSTQIHSSDALDRHLPSAHSHSESLAYTTFHPHALNGPGLPPRESASNIAFVEGRELQSYASLEQTIRRKLSVSPKKSRLGQTTTNSDDVVTDPPELSLGFSCVGGLSKAGSDPLDKAETSKDITQLGDISHSEDIHTTPLFSDSEHDPVHLPGQAIDADLFLQLSKHTIHKSSWLTKIVDSISAKIHHPHTSRRLQIDSKLMRSDGSASIESTNAKSDDKITNRRTSSLFHTKPNSPSDTSPGTSKLHQTLPSLPSVSHDKIMQRISKDKNSSSDRSGGLEQNTPSSVSSTHLNKAGKLVHSDADSDSEKVVDFTRWKEDRILGKGANGTGHVENYAHQNVLCAIKSFRKRRKEESPKEYAKKVVGEFCISSSLHHPHIVVAYDLIHKENDRYYEVLEYMAGGDLYNYLAKYHVSVARANNYTCQLVSAVNYLHDLGVVHRDLKLENVTDFGSASVYKTCFEHASRKLKGVVGSDPYIAPEEWETQEGCLLEYDAPKVDIWSTVPWKASKLTDPTYKEYTKRCKGRYPPFEDLDQGAFKDLLYRMLDPEPSERINTSALFQSITPRSTTFSQDALWWEY